MTVKELSDKLGWDIVAGDNGIDNEIKCGFVGDLLSVVMAKAEEKCAWITIQSHVNIVAVATLVGMSCIIITEGYKLDLEAQQKANEENIPIVSTKCSSYQAVSKLVELGIM